MLVEINGANAVVNFFKIGGNVHHKIAGVHIAQEPYKTTLIELHKLFAKTNWIEIYVLQIAFNEHIARDSCNVFFDERVAAREVTNAIRREQMF